MPTARTNTSFSLDGPWLLSSAALLELDKVLDEAWSDFQSERERQGELQADEALAIRARRLDGAPDEEIEELRAELKFEAMLRYPLNNVRRAIVFELLGGGAVRAERLAEALEHADLQQHHVIAVCIHLQSGSSSISITIGSGHGSNVDVTVTSSDAALAERVTARLHSWAEPHAPRPWLSRWLSLRGIHIPALFVGGLIASLLATAGDDPMRRQARELLARGPLSPEQRDRAIELLLSIESGAASAKLTNPAWVDWMWGAIVILAIALFFVPRVVVGVGRGAASLRRWQTWIELVAVLVPGYLAVQIAVPLLLWRLGVRP